MKQTIEEAASQLANAYFPEREYIDRYMLGKKSGYIRGFIHGARWQAKQSPWISVEERLPNESGWVFVIDSDNQFHVSFYIHKGLFSTDIIPNHIFKNITHWMFIPPFDEILEANKDVLQRLKEKGD